MRVSCIQLDVLLADPAANYREAERLIREAAKENPDVILLPELWDVGFFPKENLKETADREHTRVTAFASSMAKELGINIVAGSVADLRGDQVYNTACVFDRSGNCVVVYDKTHLFSPMGEDNYFAKGDHVCRFELDGHMCGIIICYDVRFPELIRTISVPGIEMLFMVSQWPDVRVPHLEILTAARAIENQMYLACCNACGVAGQTRYGGHSRIIDPWGNVLASAGAEQQTIFADCNFEVTKLIRNSMHVFAVRRPDIY